ncbi:MAG: BamA/TamA family outer membrane protein [Candidatus Marinimicrobia bacterium]|jgi:outer membrane protein insertion porin family|nr:BamA/TamA family outer membrane protein [Candidatus Neomarinimicrobiota bacterium]MBT3960529.1 BamA/TamA family outer membrane protein [Candidatus Neomarinimicrobiota bacterium]MBT4382728.1 BamA/TamA family outer membrane protein [Candidatus Neomarinimicrobiota bacterium]MBT4636652.1 BamA/TamA family outer membrane protein [Candidatus Neomarinimicrobiota bacterium]MBT4685337.1 BamA/TamA family outer membrane protein [Candidatus Neomarinimicrobiota bacterium]
MTKNNIIYRIIFWLGFVYAQSENLVISDIDIRGNVAVNDSEIFFLVRQKPPNFLIRAPKFDPRLLKLDALTIKNYYQSLGYLDVNIIDEFSIQDNGVLIIYKIVEGKRYGLKSVIITGANQLKESKIKQSLGLEIGKSYNPVKLNAGLPMLHESYQEIGKLFAEINIGESINDSVAVIVDIIEGPDVYIKKSIISGLTHYDSSIVLRELTFFDDELYSKSSIDLSVKQLRETGVFSLVSLEPERINLSDSLVNILIETKEYKRRQWESEGGYEPIQFAEGAEPISAVGAQVEWRNRSIFKTTTHFSTRLLFGIPVEEEFIIPRIRADINLGNNWFLNSRIPTQLTGYYETFIIYQKDDNEFIERFGITLANLYRFEQRSQFESKFILEQFSDNNEKNLQERSWKATLLLDRKNDPIVPTSGHFISLGAKVAGFWFGGERDYLKLDAGLQQYFSISDESVIAYRLKIGKIWGWDTTFTDYSYEQFYLGGTTSLRGWDILRFKVDENGSPIGHTTRIMTNIEWRFHLYKFLGGILFVDGGTLEDELNGISLDNTKWDYGLGISIDTPLGPARLDYAIQAEDPTQSKIQLGVQYIF